MVATPTKKSAPAKKTAQSAPLLAPNPEVVWEKLPEDFVLPGDPVDNVNQPAIAAALTDSLSTGGYLSETTITTTNYGICAKYQGKTVVKAPDWAWIPHVSVPKAEVERSYTPVLEGDLPLVVMEFISDTPGGEYSIDPGYPPGKMFYYERILQVPNYIVFNPRSGVIHHYRFSESDRYEVQPSQEQNRYWLPEANLFLGTWEGQHYDRAGLWLRWWDADQQLLLWNEEKVEAERQRAEAERQRAEQAQEKANEANQISQKAVKKLIALNLSVEEVANTLGLSTEAVQTML
ncbi:Uma2 family endonuclease [cf. Phormidesmis sp. LEGE 11477]|uniref:Uma2 family endonuclease n=1 Tax=cf. Phormidesmis sp. LEGE 11477 TaxID=1828680 RepID=UPI00187F9DC3|nr:Uma2 family endonuclease [cf. Phormidesmis sp. LEGE 11477]MBE9062663.1 Uma2 family endonuclease [cf. Phormidesmis sp. LEGE 11477]